MRIGAAAALAVWLITDDWLVASSVLTLAAIWSVLRAKEGPPVLALAMTLQWIQVTIGLFYVGMTGRQLEATVRSDYRPMVAIGLGCVATLVVGLWCGERIVERRRLPAGERPEYALTFTTLFVWYCIAVAVVGAVQQVAWSYPSITQAIIALTYVRLGLLYLLLRLLARRAQWHLMAPLIGVEVALGLTGFYAGFREPLIMAMLACCEIFDRRSVRHWLTMTALIVVMCVLGMFWISVRQGYRDRLLTDEGYAQSRSERLNKVTTDLSSAWASRDSHELSSNADQFVDRLWAVYYPALALARVPSVLPHTNGQLLSTTIEHLVMPRIFFPEKSVLGSDSDMVRKYSGVWVAGEKEHTNIAFGYAAESYVDFGVPLMFLPILVYGIVMGAVYAAFLRVVRHRDLAVSVVTVICWLSLYLFERSWVKTVGLAGTLVFYVGGLTVIFDRIWLHRVRPATAGPMRHGAVDLGAGIEYPQ